MIKNTVIFLFLCLSVSSHATDISGPFATAEEGLYTGPFKPDTNGHNRQRYLTNFAYPFSIEEGEGEKLIEVQLEDTSLSEIASLIEKAFEIKFIYEDTVKKSDGVATSATTSSTSSASLEPIKINFKTNRLMSKKELWNLFITFTDISGKMITPGPEPKTYFIAKSEVINDGIRVPLPTYLGTSYEELPDNDLKIRYLYFAQNSSANTIVQVINAIKSAGSAKVEEFPDLNALLITEKSSNIKAMMAIIKEIDRAAMPEAMSILKLNRADADTVAKLYTQLIGAQPNAGYIRPRKSPSGSYFPPNMRIIAEPRTNTLILLGTPDAIKKVEDFIKTHVDKDLEKPYSPIHTYPLKYADATTVAGYLANLVTGQANIDPIAAQYGGVRNGDKLLGPMAFVPEVKSNVLIILGDYEDYLKVYELLQVIDVEQPQVILRVLILTVDLASGKLLGTQLRSKANKDVDCTDTIPNTSLRDALGKNVTWQNSGVGPIIQNTDNTPTSGITRLLGNLIQLAAGQAAGTLAVTLGKDAYGIWGFLRVLDSFAKVNVVDTPFLVATHKTPAQIISGETRRVLESQVFGGGNSQQNSQMDISANLEVTITPLISSDGYISLTVNIIDADFTGGTTDLTRGNRNTRQIITQTSLFDKEVLAVGGIVRSRTDDIMTGVPILSKIPLIGWLFKNKSQTVTKNSLIVLISPEIIPTHHDDPMNDFTAERLADVEESFCQMDSIYQQRDPIHKWFFDDTSMNEHGMIDAFLPGQPSSFSSDGKIMRQKVEARMESEAKILAPTVSKMPDLSVVPQSKAPIITQNEQPEKTFVPKKPQKKLTDMIGGTHD